MNTSKSFLQQQHQHQQTEQTTENMFFICIPISHKIPIVIFVALVQRGRTSRSISGCYFKFGTCVRVSCIVSKRETTPSPKPVSFLLAKLTIYHNNILYN